jgi:hypothetical protein
MKTKLIARLKGAIADADKQLQTPNLHPENVAEFRGAKLALEAVLKFVRNERSWEK